MMRDRVTERIETHKTKHLLTSALHHPPSRSHINVATLSLLLLTITQPSKISIASHRTHSQTPVFLTWLSFKRKHITHFTTNANSMMEKQGEFHPHKPRDQPMTTKGHQPGLKVSGKDSAPEFSAQTLPAGTAPKSQTFTPNPQSEIPGQAHNVNVLSDDEKQSTYTSAESTLGGADSGEVHKGLGHPGAGQTSAEIRHDGQHHRKRDRAGLEGVGANVGKGIDDPKYNP